VWSIPAGWSEEEDISMESAFVIRFRTTFFLRLCTGEGIHATAGGAISHRIVVRAKVPRQTDRIW